MKQRVSEEEVSFSLKKNVSEEGVFPSRGKGENPQKDQWF